MDWQLIRQRLHKFVMNRVDNPQLAEDIVQDILLKAIKKLDNLQDEEKLLPWLYKIGRNTIIDHYRQKYPQQALPDNLTVDEEDTDSTLQELGHCIYPMIDKLPDIYKSALIQAHFDNKKLQQIADDEGVSLQAIKSRVQRGRQQLKAIFLACCTVKNDHLGNISEIVYSEECKPC